jgi:hypothetical protein
MLAITTASERNNGRQSDVLMSIIIILMLCTWMDGQKFSPRQLLFATFPRQLLLRCPANVHPGIDYISHTSVRVDWLKIAPCIFRTSHVHVDRILLSIKDSGA